ncbi:MAG: hypothetical protein ABGY95_10235 [Rubritalea sp.]
MKTALFAQLSHIVTFKFNADATAAQISSVDKHFAGLPSKILNPAIQAH